MLQTQVNYWTLQENSRHNKVMEDLGFQELYEKRRHNTQDESIRSRGNDINFGNLGVQQQLAAETMRHNVTNERMNSLNIDENIRHNKANEALGWGNVAVASAANVVAQNRVDLDRNKAQMYYKYEVPIEQQRADTESRKVDIQEQKAPSEIYRNYAGSLGDVAKGATGFMGMIK